MTMDVGKKEWVAPIKHVHGCEKERKGKERMGNPHKRSMDVKN
jgi:hypothetical protein